LPGPSHPPSRPSSSSGGSNLYKSLASLPFYGLRPHGMISTEIPSYPLFPNWTPQLAISQACETDVGGLPFLKIPLASENVFPTPLLIFTLAYLPVLSLLRPIYHPSLILIGSFFSTCLLAPLPLFPPNAFMCLTLFILF